MHCVSENSQNKVIYSSKKCSKPYHYKYTLYVGIIIMVLQYLMSEGSFPNNERWTCWSTPDEIQTVAEIYNSQICGIRTNETDEWEWR